MEASLDPASLKDYEDNDVYRQKVRDAFARNSGIATPDALILIHPNTIVQQTMIRALTFQYSGLSLNRTKGLFGKYSLLLSAQYAVSVIDTRTGREISSGTAGLPSTNIFGAHPDPILTCDEAFWPADPHNPSTGEKQQIQADVMALVAMSLPNAVQRINLSSSGNSARLNEWNGRVLMCREFS